MSLTALKMENLPHYTYDDYAQWEGRWEIINGIPYAMTPAPNLKHQQISQKIAVQLVNLLKNCKYCHAFLPVDWKINEDTVIQPDNLVVCGQDLGEKYLAITPVLVFEILSTSTSRKDRGLKYRLYQDAGVKYYCIVNPETSSAEVFRLVGQRYEESKDFQGNKIIFDLGPCTIAFDFIEVFDGEKNKQSKS
jgi:Uma2 family endonuclease